MTPPPADAPTPFLDRLLHRGPAVHLEVSIDACGTVSARAEARKDDAEITLYVGDELVALHPGEAAWTGPLPQAGPGATTVEVRAQVGRREARSSFAPAEALAGTIDVAAPEGSYAWIPVTFRFAEPSCTPSEAARFTIRVDDGALASEGGAVPAGADTIRTFRAWEGHHDVHAALSWRGWPLADVVTTIEVPVSGFDGDGDGSREGEDCDDRDPWSRPGMPEVAYDGRDNDCDGKLAGDADGDGFDADKARPRELDAAGRAALTALYPGTADILESSLLAAPRLRAADCDDRSATKHPWAAKGCGEVAGAIAGSEAVDAGPRPVSAEWAGTGRIERVLALGPGDVDMIAFQQPGLTELAKLHLTIEAAGGPVWVELWRGGSAREADGAVILGPLDDTGPILLWHLVPGAPLTLPLPPQPKKQSWTGYLWRQVGKLLPGPDDGEDGALAFLLGASAALIGTPITAAMDFVVWEKKQRARMVIPADELLYLRIGSDYPFAAAAPSDPTSGDPSAPEGTAEAGLPDAAPRSSAVAGAFPDGEREVRIVIGE